MTGYLSPLIDGMEMKSPVNRILLDLCLWAVFQARDENGNLLPGDAEFSKALYKEGLYNVLCNMCKLNPTHDRAVIKKILSSPWNVTPLKLTLGQIFPIKPTH